MPETVKMLKSFGACEHFPSAPTEDRWVVMHPRADFTGDCEWVFLACFMCRIKLVAAMQDQWNTFQAGEDCDVLECIDGHRFPTFNQYTVSWAEFAPSGT